jgi:hypothetical protein
MSGRRPASWLLFAYYGFLLLSTALAYGVPYPLFGILLPGVTARIAVVLDCLVLVHILVGVWKGQRLTWYLIFAYNGFNLASLGLSLAVLSPADLAPLVGEISSLRSFYVGVAVSAAAMAAITYHAFRRRPRFQDVNPFLF